MPAHISYGRSSGSFWFDIPRIAGTGVLPLDSQKQVIAFAIACFSVFRTEEQKYHTVRLAEKEFVIRKVPEMMLGTLR
jgi:hypothetical protein